MTIPNDLAPQEREYLDGQYPGDLEHMFALLGADISLMAFTKAIRPPSIRKWTEHFALIERKTDFLFCLFFHVLIDQALHVTGQRGVLNICRDTTVSLGGPKLCGILASAHSNVSPFFLLVTATLWLDPEGDAERKLVAYSALFRDRCEYRGIPYDYLITQAVAGEARAFADDYRAFSEAAYFKGQSPDTRLLASWSRLLLREFGVIEAR